MIRCGVKIRDPASGFRFNIDEEDLDFIFYVGNNGSSAVTRLLN